MQSPARRSRSRSASASRTPRPRSRAALKRQSEAVPSEAPSDPDAAALGVALEPESPASLPNVAVPVPVSEVNKRVETLLLSVAFSIHILISLPVGPTLIFAPELYLVDAGSAAVPFLRILGVAVCCLGIVGPVLGLLSKSRQALEGILWVELLWTGFSAVVAAFSTSGASEGACIVPVRLTSGTKAHGCLFTGDPWVAVALTALTLFVFYAHHLGFDDMKWLKAPRFRGEAAANKSD